MISSGVRIAIPSAIGSGFAAMTADAIAPPLRARRHKDVGDAKAHNIIGSERTFPIDRDICTLLQVMDPVIRDTFPGPEAMQPSLPRGAAAKFAGGLRQCHLITAFWPVAWRIQGPQAPAPTTNAASSRTLGSIFSGCPVPPPFLAHGRVLSATDRNAEIVAGHADITPDTFADLVDPALFDLPR